MCPLSETDRLYLLFLYSLFCLFGSRSSYLMSLMIKTLGICCLSFDSSKMSFFSAPASFYLMSVLSETDGLYFFLF